MIKHSIKLILRGFLKYKSSFLINLIGLSTGLACVIFIFLWVNDEQSFDRFHEKDAQLYKVLQNYSFPHGTDTWTLTPEPLADVLLDENPEVQMVTNISSEEEAPIGVLSNNDQHLEARGIFARSNFFSVFSFPLIKGNPTTTLKGKNQIVLTQTLAQSLFDSTIDPIGQKLTWDYGNEQRIFQVAGICQDPPKNSSIQFEFVLSTDILLEDEHAQKWNADYVETYVVLQPNTDIDEFNKRIEFTRKRYTSSEDRSSIFVQRYSSYYLNANYENGKLAGGRIAYVRIFSITAFFILFMACVNFMNLATAQSTQKLKEIGVKKVVGANRGLLIIQLLGEALFLSFLAGLLAIVIVQSFLPQFNMIVGKELLLDLNINFVFIFCCIIVFTGLLAGSYPAFYISGFQPLAILKGDKTNSTGTRWIRQGLVIIQFALSLIFILSVLVLNRQMHYIQNRNLGFDRTNIITFERPIGTNDQTSFLEQIKALPGVEAVSNMNNSILVGDYNQSGYSWTGDLAESDVLFKSPMIGYEFIETMGMELIAGRTFSSQFSNEREKVIINEAAQKFMGLTNPVGTLLSYGPPENKREIIGVVRDFNYGSIHHKIKPLIFRFTERGRSLIVKIKPGVEPKTIKAIKGVFNSHHPKYEFDFAFMDNDYQALYVAEQRVASLSNYFTFIAIIIACLGLFGLTTFSAERRAKEISIRKILGASTLNILGLLSKDFVRLILIAVILAIPVAWYIMNNWLNNFAYKVELSWWQFVIAGMTTLFIALLTISIQSTKAALLNPVEALKND